MPNVSYLPKLESADFSNNLIQHVPASCLYGLPIIKTLDLNDNIITSMDDNSMSRGNLYLHDNQLASPPDLYDMKIASLTLRGNSLVCDQRLCWLRMWPFDKSLTLLDKLYCAVPSFPNGYLVMDTHPVKLGCYKGKSPDYYSDSWRRLPFMWCVYVADRSRFYIFCYSYAIRFLVHVLRGYPQTSILSPCLVGNEIVDHSDVVGASLIGAAPTTPSFST